MDTPEHDRWLTVLRELPKIEDLNTEDLDAIVASGDFTVYSPGEEIDPPEAGDNFRMVAEGRMRVFARDVLNPKKLAARIREQSVWKQRNSSYPES